MGDLQRDFSAPNRLSEERYPVVPPSSSDDEISLVDVALILWRRKIIIGCFLVLGLAASVTLVASRVKTHVVTGVLTVAQYTDTQGVQKLVQPPAVLVAWLNMSILPSRIQAYSESHHANAEKIRITAATGADRNTLIVSGAAPVGLIPAYKEIISVAAGDLKKLADHRVELDMSSLESKIASLKIDLAEKQDEDLLKIKKNQLQQLVSEKKHQLADLQDQHSLLEAQGRRLAQLIKLEQSRAVAVGAYIKKIQKRNYASERVNSANDALTAMLIGNQVQRYSDLLSSLTQSVSVQLPNKIGENHTALAKNARKQQLIKGDIQQSTLKLDNFDVQHRRDVERIQLRLQQAQARLDEMSTTHLISPPLENSKASNKSAALIVAMGVILGGVLGIFGAFALELLEAVRERVGASYRKATAAI